jgi:copper chaperone CopZ
MKMKTEKIIIANLKCGGCESTIKNRLLEMDGVLSVDVNHDEDSVTINHGGNVERNKIVQILNGLGYPEATEENGLILQLKSYASCMVGRIHNLSASKV